MGRLTDKANQQSNFLVIEKGTSVVVKFLSWREVPSSMDPTKDVIQYKVVQDGKEKFWTNGSGAVMRTMDKIKEGSWIEIRRDRSFNKDGVEDKSKSTYMVRQVETTGQTIDSGLAVPATTKEQAWDE